MEIGMLTIDQEGNKEEKIKYWIEALSNPNVSNKNKALINKVLENELWGYIEPTVLKKEPFKMEYDIVWNFNKDEHN